MMSDKQMAQAVKLLVEAELSDDRVKEEEDRRRIETQARQQQERLARTKLNPEEARVRTDTLHFEFDASGRCTSAKAFRENDEVQRSLDFFVGGKFDVDKADN